MKKPRASIDFAKAREKEIVSAFRRLLPRLQHIVVRDVAALVAALPSPRYWVSEERAAIVLSRMLRGQPLGPMRPLRLAMFRELRSAFESVRHRHPRLPYLEAVHMAVNSPASSFFMAPETVAKIIYQYLSANAIRSK